MDQGRCLQRMAAALPPQVAGRLVAQFLVDEWGEPVQRPPVAGTPLLKEMRNVVRQAVTNDAHSSREEMDSLQGEDSLSLISGQ